MTYKYDLISRISKQVCLLRKGVAFVNKSLYNGKLDSLTDYIQPCDKSESFVRRKITRVYYILRKIIAGSFLHKQMNR